MTMKVYLRVKVTITAVVSKGHK